MEVHELAGGPVPAELLVNIPRLVSAYYKGKPDVRDPAQKVSFGPSGHRGSSLHNSFNEDHVLAICQALCEHRRAQGITGPLYMGKDTHALSEPAQATAIEVFAANDVDVVIQAGLGYTPAPVISHAILAYNCGKRTGLSDGVIITPSHNPPDEGGFKYNPPSGGPAELAIAKTIQDRANEILMGDLREVKRWPLARAVRAGTTHEYDYAAAYVADLRNVVDMQAIARSGLKVGVDPLGGAGVAYWDPIAEMYGLAVEVVNRHVDPTFSFMCLDRDGKIRMDPSSPYAMASLIGLKDRFDIAFGNDTDCDRHGIVTPSAGLMSPNHYLAAAIWYLFQYRPAWGHGVFVGKTLVSSTMIDRVTDQLGRALYEVPVGFQYFVEGLLDGSLGFCGEESAGASFLRTDGTVWTTDKDGIILDLLAAEITATTGRDPGEHYQALESRFGSPVYERMDVPANELQRAVLANLSSDLIQATELAGEKIIARLTRAPGNSAAMGGLKVITENGWFAARPSGTDDVYKVYAESFRDAEHLRKIQDEAQAIVAAAFRAAGL
jgi:phosphoglucomutase